MKTVLITGCSSGYGLETELAEPDGNLVTAAAAALEALEALAKPLAALTRRLEAIIEDAPDWLDSQARARVEGALALQGRAHALVFRE